MRIKVLIRDMPLRQKLLSIYFLVISIPVLILGYYLTYGLNNAFINNTLLSCKSSINQLEQNLTNKLAVINEILNTFAYNEKVIEYIIMKYQTDTEIYDAYKKEIAPFFKTIQFKEKNLSMKIYTENSSIGISNVFITDIKDSGVNKSINEIYSKNNRINWMGLVDYNDENSLTCYAFIKDYYHQPIKDIGVLFLYFKENGLFSLIDKYSQTGSFIYIVNDSREILTSSDRTSVGKKIDTLFTDGTDLFGIDSGKNIKINNKDFLLVKQLINRIELDINNWQIILLIPLSNLKHEQARIWLTTLLLCVFCIIFSSSIVIIFSRTFTNRIKFLIGKMNKVRNGDTAVTINAEHSDEIGELYNSFDVMIKSLNKLMTEVFEANLKVKDTEILYHKIAAEKKESEFLALQSQINPHYLFNTLESIRMKALLKGDRETSDVIRLFSASFRSIIFDRQDKVKIRDELKNIINYFKIQKYRFGDKISFRIKASKEVLDFFIPKLIIQPLAENSVYHGLELKEGKGSILIRISAADGRLIICVEDDGIGMDQKTLDLLFESIKGNEPGTKNFALKNIYSRLKHIYGERFTFLIESKPDEGTRTEIIIPVEVNNV